MQPVNNIKGLSDADLMRVLRMALGGTATGRKAPGDFGGLGPQSPGGFFGVVGLEQSVISTVMSPRGLLDELPVHPDNLAYPEFGYITGIYERAGQTEPDKPCATCLSGETTVCVQTAQFGYVCRESNTIDPAKTIERINRGQMDLTIVNSILGNRPGSSLLDPTMGVNQNQALEIATTWGMMEAGVLFQNALIPMLWQGNPANDVGTGYKEFPGLDMLIATGHVDAHKGTTCDALDSDIKDFNYNDITTTEVNGQFKIVRYIEYMEAYLFNNATRQNLQPVTWDLVMRPELWYELTQIWPVTFLTTRGLTLPSGATIALDAGRVRELMDEMRTGMFLPVNGRRLHVVLDDGIYEYTNVNNAHVGAGCYASSINFVPMTYLGGREATYLQHKDYRQLVADYTAAHVQQFYWTDGGRFQWTSETKKWCYSISGRVEPRVILLLPQLAGRIEHVGYCPLQHFRGVMPDDPYWTDGGVSTRDLPNLYSAWNPSGR